MFWIVPPQSISIIGLTALLIGSMFFESAPSTDWISFILDKGGVTALAALSLYMLRQSYQERISEQQRHKEEMATLFRDRERIHADFREELATLHQAVLSALSNNTEVLTEFKTRVEKCPATVVAPPGS